MRQTIDVNSDMGEGFGPWAFEGDVDERLMPLVSSINLAAGFHAGDPRTIDRVASLAQEHGVSIGVHPGFRDLVGFGRRHIDASAAELVCDVLYQLGAVRALVERRGARVQHLKLHGALYMHAARDEDFATALVDALDVADAALPILTMAGSVLDRVASERGHPVIRELYADRHYADDGQIVFTRNAAPPQPQDVVAKIEQACAEGTVQTTSGATVPISFDSICVHSDTPGAVAVATAVRDGLARAGVTVRAFA